MLAPSGDYVAVCSKFHPRHKSRVAWRALEVWWQRRPPQQALAAPAPPSPCSPCRAHRRQRLGSSCASTASSAPLRRCAALGWSSSPRRASSSGSTFTATWPPPAWRATLLFRCRTPVCDGGCSQRQTFWVSGRSPGRRTRSAADPPLRRCNIRCPLPWPAFCFEVVGSLRAARASICAASTLQFAILRLRQDAPPLAWRRAGDLATLGPRVSDYVDAPTECGA